MAYNGRRAPDISEYIGSLNTIPSEQELQSQNEFKFDDDLALFTNANFFDFDLGQAAELSPTTATFPTENTSPAATVTTDMGSKVMKIGDFNFNNYNALARPGHGITEISPINTKVPYPASSSATSPVSAIVSPSMGQHLKRTSEHLIVGEEDEESARLAAEEDKRRRNTAASARFRVKKKQREQALEKSAKEMSDKVAALEGRINQLETENRWLKNLITEKNTIPQVEDLGTAWKRYTTELAKDKLERIKDERKDGVGTLA